MGEIGIKHSLTERPARRKPEPTQHPMRRRSDNDVASPCTQETEDEDIAPKEEDADEFLRDARERIVVGWYE